MPAFTIQETLLQCPEGRVVLACDAEQRPMLGISPRDSEAFVQIDRVTALELQRGLVDWPTALAERRAGLVIAA